MLSRVGIASGSRLAARQHVLGTKLTTPHYIARATAMRPRFLSRSSISHKDVQEVVLPPPSAPATKRIRIYTRTGDKGTSSLFTGERRAKDDLVFEALGATDELSSILGLAREFCVEQNNGLAEKLEMIQCHLQDAGSNIATPRKAAPEPHLKRTDFDADGQLVTELEHWIDTLEESLPARFHFILPSGGKAASTLHVARSVCRRAERRIVPLVQANEADTSVGKYINRLSDFLFTAARYAAAKEGRPEQIYKRVRPPSERAAAAAARRAAAGAALKTEVKS